MGLLPEPLKGKNGLVVGIANKHSIAAVTGNIAYVDAGYHVMA